VNFIYDDIVHALQNNNTYWIWVRYSGGPPFRSISIHCGSCIPNHNANSNSICNPNLTLILPDPRNGGPLNPERLRNRTATLTLTLASPFCVELKHISVLLVAVRYGSLPSQEQYWAGRTLPQNNLPIWPPMTYVEVKCHITTV